MLARKYFENKLASPSTEDEGDLDIDYDYQEVRSFDRSSAGSIPWAEDAIKQNQQEWERIESCFYNENNEQLPTDDKDLCREILEWKRFFRHKGNHIQKNKNLNQLKTVVTQKSNESDVESDDETLIENSTANTLKSSKIPLRNLTSLSKTNQNDNRHNEKQSAKSVNFPIKFTNNANINTLSKNFAKDLRINSVPKSNKRTSIIQNTISTTQNLQPQSIPIKIVQRHYPHPHQLIPSQSAKYLLAKYPNSIVTVEKKISPHSATYSRMQPVYNLLRTGNTKIIPIYNQSYQFQSRYGTLRPGGRNQKNQVILPALNSVHTNDVPSSTALHGNSLRSISAIHPKHCENRQMKNMSDLKEYLPSLSASNKYKYP